MFSKFGYWGFGAKSLFWRFSHSGFLDRAPRSKVHETTKTWKLLSWNERNVHEILKNWCWGFVGRKWCLRCAPELNLVMSEKKQCLRDAQHLGFGTLEQKQCLRDSDHLVSDMFCNEECVSRRSKLGFRYFGTKMMIARSSKTKLCLFVGGHNI